VIVQSWDLAFKGENQHDFVVGLVACRCGADVYLLQRFKAHATFQETVRAIEAMIARYPKTSAIYVEDAANGAAVLDTLARRVSGLIAVKPEGGKYSRAAACESQIEAGNLYLPRPTGPNGAPIPSRAWVPDFVEQLVVFPRGEHDDDVDALTQLLIRCRRPSLTPEFFDELWRVNRRATGPGWPKRL
jgi:predicted phage terminase large subunit-like protein